MNEFYTLKYSSRKKTTFSFRIIEILMESIQKKSALSNEKYKEALEILRKRFSLFAAMRFIQSNAIFRFGPQTVILDYDFWFGIYPVTFYEFNQYCSERAKQKPNSYQCQPLSSVNNITWKEAVAYCNWLSWKTGLMSAYDDKGFFLNSRGERTTNIKEVEGYRLPTAAEWQFVKKKYGFERRVLSFSDGKIINPNKGSLNDLYQVLKEAINPNGCVYRNPRDHEYCHDRYKLNFTEEGKPVDPYIFDKTTTQRTNFFNPVGNESGSFHVLMDFTKNYRMYNKRKQVELLRDIHETALNSDTTLRVVRTRLSDGTDDSGKGRVFIR